MSLRSDLLELKRTSLDLAAALATMALGLAAFYLIVALINAVVK